MSDWIVGTCRGTSSYLEMRENSAAEACLKPQIDADCGTGHISEMYDGVTFKGVYIHACIVASADRSRHIARRNGINRQLKICLLYTSDAADD